MDTSDLQKALAQAGGTGAVNILYFARLREALGRDREQLTLPADVNTVGGLLALLRARGSAWEAELAPPKPVRVAVNQSMAHLESAIHPGDEIAFFPPVTGG
jgi:molybdopterin synthase sulfur carrier subunit